MKIGRLVPALMIVVGLNKAVLAAGASIVSNQSDILPNLAGQQIQLLITGSDAIAGTDLYIQLDSLSGSAPSITNLNLTSGTIFTGNNTSQKGLFIGSGTISNFASVGTTTASGTIPITSQPGVLVTLTVDTTGISAGGVFHLNMATTYNGTPSDFVHADHTTFLPTYGSDLFTIDVAPFREWNINGGGTWGTDSNWTPFAPYTTGDQANFLDAATSGTATVTLDGDRIAGSITFNNTSASYIIAPGTGGSLHLNGASPSISDLAGNHTISAPIVLSANTSVVSNASSTLTLGGAVSGAFNLAFSGLGKIFLTGSNSFANGSIASGTTVLFATSAAGNSGGAADINNGNIVYTQMDSTVVSTSITGTGTITQAGAGTTTFTGANGYSGPTFINAGKLIIGIGTAGTVGTGQITNSSSLVFNRSNTLSVSAPISGTGTITQSGTGTTTLNGNGYTATGPLSVGQGALVFSKTTNVRNTPAIGLQFAHLTMSNGTVLDSTNHDLLIGNSSVGTVQDMILAAFGAGNNPGGPQITSSTFASEDTFMIPIDANLFGGVGNQTLDGMNITQPNSVWTKYVYNGDVTLDGVVDASDVQQVINDYVLNTTTPGLADITTSWLAGDILFEGSVSADDIQQEINDYVAHNASSPLGTLTGDPIVPATVPEPGTLAITALILRLLSRRTLRRFKKSALF